MDATMQLARDNMIEQQIRPWEVLDPRVLSVFREIARHRFVPEHYQGVAYTDVEIPIGHGEKMMKPIVEGRLLQALELNGDERVLEIGTGSGYLTACLAHLADYVLSVERHDDLAAVARRRLLEADIGNADILTADALTDFRPEGRFDAIAVTGAVVSIPGRFTDWLAPNGRLFVVRGQAPVMEAVLISRIDGDHLRTDSLFETELDYLSGATPTPRFIL